MATSPIIFDSTYTTTNRRNGQVAWDQPLPGSSFCVWMAGWVLIPWCPPNYVPTKDDFLRVIDAVLAGKSFNTGTDVYRYGAGPYWSRWVHAPTATPHSFQLDWEISWLKNAPASYYANIMTAIAQKHPGIRMVNGEPNPLQGFDDGALKTPNWTPTTAIVNAATTYYNANKSWIDQLWGIVLTSYFGNPKNDQAVINWTYNRISLARQVFPGRRLIIQTNVVRSTSWYPPGGNLSQQVITNFAGVVKSAHPDGVIVWGDRTANLPMLAAFGITSTGKTDGTTPVKTDGGTVPIQETPIQGTPIQISPTTPRLQF